MTPVARVIDGGGPAAWTGAPLPLSGAVLTLSRGEVVVPAAVWRRLQRLQRAGSRFV